MKARFSATLLICLFFVACDKKKQNVIGVWENTSLKVTMKLEDGTDSITNIPEGSWKEVLKIKPIITTYRPNGTFKSVYFSLKGESFGVEEGTWCMPAAFTIPTQAFPV